MFLIKIKGKWQKFSLKLEKQRNIQLKIEYLKTFREAKFQKFRFFEFSGFEIEFLENFQIEFRFFCEKEKPA